VLPAAAIGDWMRIVAVFAFVSFASVAQGQNLLVNASFEAPAAGATFVTRSGSFGTGGGWSISANVDHIGGLWQSAAGSQSVDLNGSTTGSVSQTFATTPGAMYAVRYAVSENFFGVGNKTMQVKWGSDVIDDVSVIGSAACVGDLKSDGFVDDTDF
jgi:hypothetical protein